MLLEVGPDLCDAVLIDGRLVVEMLLIDPFLVSFFTL